MAQTDTEAAYEQERAALREIIQTTDSDEERSRAFQRLAEIGRERHRDIFEKLARE